MKTKQFVLIILTEHKTSLKHGKKRKDHEKFYEIPNMRKFANKNSTHSASYNRINNSRKNSQILSRKCCFQEVFIKTIYLTVAMVIPS